MEVYEFPPELAAKYIPPNRLGQGCGPWVQVLGAGPGARSVAGRLFQIQGISAGVANKFCSGALRINNNAIVGLFRVCISRSSERTRARSLWGDTSLIWSSVTSLCFRSCTGVSSSMFRHSSNAHSRSLVVASESGSFPSLHSLHLNRQIDVASSSIGVRGVCYSTYLQFSRACPSHVRLL